MIQGFHDEDFDGVVLKIPIWLIEMNGLEKDFEAFEKALKGVKKSMYLPDHVKNIHELENRKTKAKDIADKRKWERESKERELANRKENFRSLLACDHYELEYRKMSIEDDADSIRLNGKWYENKDSMTHKGSMVASFKKEFEDVVKTKDDLVDFMTDNPYLGHYASEISRAKDHMIKSFHCYITSNTNFGLMIERVWIKYDWRVNKNGDYGFRITPLEIDENGNYTLPSFLTARDRHDLSGFERQGMKLVKRKEQGKQ